MLSFRVGVTHPSAGVGCYSIAVVLRFICVPVAVYLLGGFAKKLVGGSSNPQRYGRHL